ncbi:N-acetylneuraminate synthase [Peloplasma aerotolerans]|uniref:N-acetylneuraminate synthase n=1 Tax=Peloplasma aerotolerans TaxID=3044389 RepID=A0AAW6U3E9_9MOLU|nr:N-acetylneuraminate synthase [Mariniplasma sp. M4Ah]MDI6452392.1 N-acetylneuraminate synthase [Mariniplasma sp. M4Ah]
MSVFIIAEAGVNHNGSIELAKKLVDAAKAAGADCVKFQTYISENIVSKNALKAEYQKTNLFFDETQHDMLKKLELPYKDFLELKNYCKIKQIEFMSTAFDLDSIDFLQSIGMNRWKIPSGDITNLPYLIKIAEIGKPVIISTGMSTMNDIENAVKVLKDNGTKNLIVLHCTTEYPTPFEDVNLIAMLTIKDVFEVEVGYSDHTKGIEVPIAAVALGAKVIEKHFTLDRNMEGPDHKASLEPNELKSMIEAIRNIELSLGDGKKLPAESEKKNMSVARKSIIAKKSIKKGEFFNEQNLTVKRPGDGISPMKWFEVIGKIAPRDFDEDELIEL